MNERIPTTLTPEEVKEANAAMREWLSPEAGHEGTVKAAQAVTELVRVRVREGSIARNILAPTPIGADDLVPSLTDDDPRYIGEIEPEIPGGIVIPLAARPEAWYFYGRRYEARFSRVETPRFMKDTSQLLTYKRDLRQIISDASLKDLLGLEDTRFFMAVNNMLAPAASAAGGPLAAGEVIPASGIVQWRQLNAGVTRVSVNDALAIMTDSNFGLKPATAVINLHFAYELQKWWRGEVGGDLAQEIAQKGFTEREMFGTRFLITIKNWLVPNGVMYCFAPQEFIGPNLVLTDTTMHVKKDAYIITFWAYEEVAQVIANIPGITRIDFLTAM